MPRKVKERRRDVPEKDHVARYCNPQSVIRDPETGRVIGLFPDAFELRPKLKETYLSTHWMEYFDADNCDRQFKECLSALRVKHKNVKPSGVSARMSVGAVIAAGRQQALAIRVRDRSEASDPGYSGIYGQPLDNSDRQFLTMLSENCCVEIREIKEIDELT